MAFSTIQGSGGAPDSFVGTLGVDSIVLSDNSGNFVLGAQADDDLIIVGGSGNQVGNLLTTATLKGGSGDDTFVFEDTGADAFTFGTDFLNGIFVNGNKDEDTFEFQGFNGEDALELVSSTILGGAADDSFDIDDTDLFATIVNGNKGQDAILFEDGSAERSTIRGGDDNDLIEIEDAFGDITDSLIAGDLGDDRIFLDEGDIFDSTISGGEGTDQIRTLSGMNFDGSTVLGEAGIDIISIQGSGSYTIDGGEGADSLTSVDFNTSAVTFIGGEGTDSMALGADSNTVLYTANTDFGAASSTTSNLALALGDAITGFDNTTDFVQIGSIVSGVGTGAADVAVNGAWNLNLNGFLAATGAGVLTGVDLAGATAAEFQGAINGLIGPVTGDAGDVGVISIRDTNDVNYLVQVTLGSDRDGIEELNNTDSLALIATSTGGLGGQVVAANIGYSIA